LESVSTSMLSFLVLEPRDYVGIFHLLSSFSDSRLGTSADNGQNDSEPAAGSNDWLLKEYMRYLMNSFWCRGRENQGADLPLS
jgi:hypothetical protein